MKVPIEWLKDYIDFSETPLELQEILTMRGLEVEDADEDVLNIELTPNRGDCASIIGIARELSAYSGKPYKIPESDYPEIHGDIRGSYKLRVEIPDKCPIYYLKFIKNVKIGESPDWIKKRLKKSGIRPLNNVIDITNYVMIEMGQPLHAFDADKINGDTIFVRKGKPGEEILTLDGETQKLTPDEIVIADADAPIAIGGVMGGENSSITSDTRHILLESAFFVGDSIVRTARRLEISTESSYRFARHIDGRGVKKALDRAAYLIKKICSGEPVPGELCEKNIDLKLKKITLDVDSINKVLGTSVNAEQVRNYLESLSFKVDVNKDILSAEVPSYRNDISRPIDIIEEIARIHGYENIRPTLPESKIVTELLKNPDNFITAEEILRSAGYWETITHSLVSGELYNKICSSENNAVEIDNPINVNMDILRPNLIFGLLDVCKYNINQKQLPIKFFERGTVFFKTNGNYNETSHIAFISAGNNFFESKKLITSILNSLNQDFSFEYYKDSYYFDLNRSSKIKINGKFAGEFGWISGKLLKFYKLADLKFVGGYILIDTIDKERMLNKKFMKWSQYPSVFRDLSLLVPANLTHSEIYDNIKLESGGILKDIRLYDVYQDEKLGLDKKSMTYTLEFNSKSRTLTALEVDERVKNILKALESEFGITLRPE